MLLPLVFSPSPLLKKISKPVAEVNDDVRKFLHNLLETMYYNDGVGLAAVQTGSLINALVMDVGDDVGLEADFDDEGDIKYKRKNSDKLSPIFMVNPQIITKSKNTSVYNEGCLSFPSVRADITRPEKVTVKYLDYRGREKTLEADKLLSTCVQHEMDHLRGVSFVDYLSKLKRDVMLKKVNKFIKQNYSEEQSEK